MISLEGRLRCLRWFESINEVLVHVAVRTAGNSIRPIFFDQKPISRQRSLATNQPTNQLGDIYRRTRRRTGDRRWSASRACNLIKLI